MSRNEPYEDDDDDDGGQQTTPLVKDLRKQLKDALKRASEQDAELATLRSVDRTRKVSELLTAKGVKAPAKVAKLVPTDVDATDEALSAWLEDYADVLGIEQKQQKSGDDDGGDGDGQPPNDGTGQPTPAEMGIDDIAVLRQMDRVQQSALSPQLQSSVAAKLNDPALTEEGLLAILANPASVGAA